MASVTQYDDPSADSFLKGGDEKSNSGKDEACDCRIRWEEITINGVPAGDGYGWQIVSPDNCSGSNCDIVSARFSTICPENPTTCSPIPANELDNIHFNCNLPKYSPLGSNTYEIQMDVFGIAPNCIDFSTIENLSVTYRVVCADTGNNTGCGDIEPGTGEPTGYEGQPGQSYVSDPVTYNVPGPLPNDFATLVAYLSLGGECGCTPTLTQP